MDEIDFDLSDASRESSLDDDIDWLEAASTTLRTPMPAPLPPERAPRGSSAGIQLLTGFDEESVTVERVRAPSEPTIVD